MSKNLSRSASAPNDGSASPSKTKPAEKNGWNTVAIGRLVPKVGVLVPDGSDFFVQAFDGSHVVVNRFL
jgi:hypothetical protein